MKVTIELTATQVKGIKAYLDAVGDCTPTNDDVKQYIKGIVDGVLCAPQESVSDYIRRVDINS